MLKIWSRIALASCLVLMVGATVASATTARVRSLANTGDYISDDSAVNRFYSTLTSFGNQVNAELGQYFGYGSLANSRALSWNHSCGDKGKYGTYRITLDENTLDNPGVWIGNPFYQNHAPMNDPTFDLGDPVGAFENTPFNKWDLAGAWEVGQQMSVGLAVTQSKWSAEDQAANAKVDDSWLTAGAGVSWSNNDNMMFDGALNFGTAGGKYTDGTNTVEWDSKTGFDVVGRMFYDWKDNVTIVPVAEFTTSNYSLKSSPAALTAPNGIKKTDVMVGVGLNMDVNQDNMLVFALEWMRHKAEYSNADTTATGLSSDTYNYLPTVRLALETHINSWLTTRIGAAKYLVTLTEETNNGQQTKATGGWPYAVFDGPPIDGFEWFLGCGFTVAEWTVDVELAPETPFGLGYWLTGYSAFPGPAGPGPVARISACYNY